MPQLKKLLPILVLFLAFSTCHKDKIADFTESNITLQTDIAFDIETPLKERFFNDSYILNGNSNLVRYSHLRDYQAVLSTLQYIIDYQDDQEHFIDDLIEEVGYPVWAEADVMDEMIFLPFIKEESEAVEALLVVKVENDYYDFKLLLRNRIYNNILDENVHPNFEMELHAFYEYDRQLFEVEDALIINALETDFDENGSYRCQTYIHMWCSQWGPIAFKEEKQAEERGCGANCVVCKVTTYFINCGIGLGGWGTTGSFPPFPDGDSDYGGGTGNNSTNNGDNPDNWWEEEEYDEVLISIIEDLDIEEEDVALVECMADRPIFKAKVFQLISNINLDNLSVQNAVQEAINFACVCDDINSTTGKERCDEISMFAKNLLESFYDVEIVSTVFIDGTLYGVDTNGLLHIFIDPVDMNTASKEEILDQTIEVLSKIHEYFCEGNSYEPIEWNDYFDHLKSQSFTIDWGGCGTINLDLNVSMGNIMETDPSSQGDTGSGWIYTFYEEGTSLPLLSISLSYGCVPLFDDLVFPNC